MAESACISGASYRYSLVLYFCNINPKHIISSYLMTLSIYYNILQYNIFHLVSYTVEIKSVSETHFQCNALMAITIHQMHNSVKFCNPPKM